MALPTGRARFLVTGLIPLVVVLVVWLTPIFVISGIDQRIGLLESMENLALPEQKMLADLRWRKTWWMTHQVTVFNPIATLLLVAIVTVTVALIAYWLAWRRARAVGW